MCDVPPNVAQATMLLGLPTGRRMRAALAQLVGMPTGRRTQGAP